MKSFAIQFIVFAARTLILAGCHDLASASNPLRTPFPVLPTNVSFDL